MSSVRSALASLRFAGLFVTLLLAGCYQAADELPPRAFAKVDSGYRDPQHPECPNLEGSFDFNASPGSEFKLDSIYPPVSPAQPWQALLIERGPLGCRFDSSEAQPGQSTTICGLHLSTRMAPAMMDAAGDELRLRDPQAYSRWWAIARRGVPTDGDIRAALQAYEAQLGAQGPVQDRRHGALYPLCEDGWLQLHRRVALAELGGGDGFGELWVARAEGGELVARLEYDLQRDEITVWCGDGCKGIPYRLVRDSRWAKFAMIDRPPMWSLRPQRLPSLQQAEAAARAESPVAVILSPLQTPPILRPEDVVIDRRVFELEDRFRRWLRDDRLDIWRIEEGRIFVSGISPRQSDVSRLLRLLAEDSDVERAELVAIGPDMTQASSLRFNLMLRLKPAAR